MVSAELVPVEGKQLVVLTDSGRALSVSSQIEMFNTITNIIVSNQQLWIVDFK